jgi:LPS export ABC transporter protein LptC
MSSPTDALAHEHDRMLRSAARRARFAPYLSLVAAAAAVGFVALFLYQSGAVSSLFEPARTVPTPTVAMPDQITGQFSRYAGYDHEGQPYELTARSGYQDKEKAQLVHMEGVAGIFHRSTGEPYRLNSAKGLYDTKLKRADLVGTVRIEQEGRFVATMETAQVDLESKDMTTSSPVVVEMQGGTIRANGLKISNDGKNILFLNGVIARFEESTGKGDAPQ